MDFFQSIRSTVNAPVYHIEHTGNAEGKRMLFEFVEFIGFIGINNGDT